ncbi:MAG TPA: zinc-dependent alcohol dehydrogenase family protein [Phycisphaerae bacterium]|nr:zinc-dependent alcohol dehydrogenase family protein [Phycisphaerae bacterium]
MILNKTAPVGESPLTPGELDVPSTRPGQIGVQVNVCGVCHTDLHTVEGELAERAMPIIPGHQVIGVVDRLGEGATRFKVGQRAGLAWLYRTCGACKFCRRGEENLCPNALFTGYDVPGGYAEYVVVDEDFAYELPEGLPDEQAAPLMCAGIIGYRALRLSGVTGGQRLGLYGFGASAHVTIQVARHLGCQVFVFSRSESHRELARQLGAVWCGRAEDEPPEKLDGSIIFAPAGGLVPTAMEHLDRGGTCALAGIYMSQLPPMDYEKHLYYEKTLRSVTASTRRDGVELLELAAEVPVRTQVRTYPLAEANRVLQLLKAGKIDGAAVLRVGA